MRKNRGLIIIFICLTMLAFLAYFFFKPSKPADYVAKLNHYEVPLTEYMIYFREQQLNFDEIGGEGIWETTFYGEPTFDVAKQYALDSLVYIKLMAKEAENNNILLTEEENKLAAIEAADYYSRLSENEKSVIDYDYAASAIKEKILVQKYIHKLLEEYKINPDLPAFQDYYRSYIEDNFTNLFHVKVSIIILDKDDSIGDELYKKAKDGADFSLLLAKYSLSEDYAEYDLHLMEDISKSDKVDIMLMEKGDIYPPLETGARTYIVKLMERPSDTELADLKARIYTNFENSRIEDLYNRLRGDVIVEKNSDVWDKIQLIEK